MKNSILTIIPILFFLLISTSNIVVPQNTIENYIDATFNIKMSSATDLSINIELIIHQITLSIGKVTYSNEDIENLAINDPIILGAISQELNYLIFQTLNSTFWKTEISSNQVLPIYKGGKFYANFSVNLTSDFFEINKTINPHELINGLLDMGAYVYYEFDLYAQPGWNNIFNFNLGTKYDKNSTNGLLDGNSNEIKWEIKNRYGDRQKTRAYMNLYKISPTTKSPVEDIFINFIIDSSEVVSELEIKIISRNISIEEYNVLPSFISNINNVTSDGVRLLLNNHLLSIEQLEEITYNPVINEVIKIIESPNFNQSLDFVIVWDDSSFLSYINSYDINYMDHDPPLMINLTDDEIKLEILDLPSRAIFGLVNSGATLNLSRGANPINFGEELKNQGLSYPYQIKLILPDNISLNEMNEFIWNETKEFMGIMNSSNAPNYLNEEKHTIIEIEFKSTDLNLLGFFTGDTEIFFGLEINEIHLVNILDITEESKYFKLPQGIELNNNLLNSDGIRICIDEEIFSEQKIDSFLIDKKVNYERRIKNIIRNIDIRGNIKRDLFDKSLEWDKNFQKMDSEKPIETKITSRSAYPVRIDISFILPSVNIPVQKYNFSGINNQSVTYRIIFPNGIDLELNDPYNKSKLKEKEDKRKYIEITFDKSESNLNIPVSCKIKPSLIFLISVFTPCIIAIVLTIVLIIIVILIRRKKRFKGQSYIGKKEDFKGYDDEEYYISPPDPKQKKS
jgi:hypothetical protein